MELAQTRTIDAPRDKVWHALNDPQTLRACIPGCESFEPDGDNAYHATVATRVGPVSARFNGKLRLADIDPPIGYTLSFEGQGGAAGFASGNAKVSLAPTSERQTALSYTVKAQVGGKLAQIGNRLIDSAAAKLADDFFTRFALAVGEPAAPAAAAPEAMQPVAMAASGEGNRWVRVLAIGAIIAVLIVLYAVTR
ncbi:MAG TPA: carbon monoxide dehydrogenase subunit G [Casimicrobiaceae bacterium]|nr:carbon monoxide dehydrogenase subunit G [Casimicrobiaceae bacterium]